jgi:phycoerythrin-associated linker protein
MPSTFVNPVVNPDMTLGVAARDETAPIRHWPLGSVDETDTVIRAVYKQVLGNAYVMESERQQAPESRFRQGQISVVEFIRQIAKSDLYRSRFFENGPRNRFIELNFKHFLGRAPESVAEVAAHSKLLDQAGYEAEIDAYLDSDEYTQAFGSDTVPYFRGYKTEAGRKLVGFTHMFPLLRGESSSDKNITHNNPARLNRTLFSGQASSVISPSGASSRQGSGGPLNTGDLFRSLFARSADSQVPSFESASSAASAPAPTVDPSVQGSQAEQLQKQIDELRSLSNMGAYILSKGQQPSAAEAQSGALTQQAKTIEQLQGELMLARSQASIAEYKLNKWQQRFYSRRTF